MGWIGLDWIEMRCSDRMGSALCCAVLCWVKTVGYEGGQKKKERGRSLGGFVRVWSLGGFVRVFVVDRSFLSLSLSLSLSFIVVLTVPFWGGWLTGFGSRHFFFVFFSLFFFLFFFSFCFGSFVIVVIISVIVIVIYRYRYRYYQRYYHCYHHCSYHCHLSFFSLFFSFSKKGKRGGGGVIRFLVVDTSF